MYSTGKLICCLDTSTVPDRVCTHGSSVQSLIHGPGHAVGVRINVRVNDSNLAAATQWAHRYLIGDRRTVTVLIVSYLRHLL
jgi:hypothetical protein